MTPRRYSLALIPCTKTKNPAGVTARTLYRGGIFSLMLRHAMQRCDRVLIMSALHGLVELDAPIGPYDAFLLALSPYDRALLARKMKPQVDALIEEPRILSYLYIPYFNFFRDLAPKAVVDATHRPYKGLPTAPATLQRVLSNEIRCYETHPSRR